MMKHKINELMNQGGIFDCFGNKMHKKILNAVHNSSALFMKYEIVFMLE
jgi:hypothetical protein